METVEEFRESQGTAVAELLAAARESLGEIIVLRCEIFTNDMYMPCEGLVVYNYIPDGETNFAKAIVGQHGIEDVEWISHWQYCKVVENLRSEYARFDVRIDNGTGEILSAEHEQGTPLVMSM